MTRNWWTAKNLVFIAAVLSLACVAAFVVIGLAYPEPVPSATLGPEWQCSRLAFVFTTCTRLTRTRAAATRAVKEPMCLRRRSWIAHLSGPVQRTSC